MTQAQNVAVESSQINSSGVLQPAGGGTGAATLTANNVLLGNGTSAVQFVAPGTTGNLLTSNGTTWASSAPPVSMVYPGAGIANSTGTAWGTSYTTSGSGTVVALATSPSFTTPSLGAATGTTLTLSGQLAVNNTVYFNAGTGASDYNDLNLGGVGGWSGNESHGINTYYGSIASPTIFSRLDTQFNGSAAVMRWKNFYYSGAQTSTVMTLTAASTTTANLNVTGSVTATSFSGSGSSLTNIPTSIVAGSGISVSGATGAVTVTNTAAGIAWQGVQAANFAATAGYGYPVNTTSASITATLPASPTAGQVIAFVDYAGTWGTNNFIIAPNGRNFNGSTTNATVATNREGIEIVYADATKGWIPYAGFNDSTPAQVYTVSYLNVSAGGGGGTGATGVGAQPNGGAGGGGGVQTGTASVATGTAYTITIGGGGGVSGGGNPTSGLSTSTSGGNPSSGRTGGSSGSPTSFGGGGGGNYSGGGGGGAGGSGGGAPASITGGNGGVGLYYSTYAAYGDTANPGYFGGGGGGGQGSTGGAGGGGTGGGANYGQANTGGGGGGGYGAPGTGGGGGSGVFIINYAGTQRGTGGTYNYTGGNSFHLFTTSGTYTG